MKRIAAFVIVFCALRFANADTVQPIEHTISPTGICIVLVPDADSNQFRFWDTKTERYVGNVLPPDMDGVRDPAFVTDWNASGTRLALLFYYGTKLSSLYLYKISADGMMKSVSFDCPDSSDEYASVNKHKWALSDSSGASYNSLGPWLDDKTVRLIAGDSKDVRDDPKNASSTLLVTFIVSFKDSSAVVSDKKLIGPLADADRDAFFKKWGEQYQ